MKICLASERKFLLNSYKVDITDISEILMVFLFTNLIKIFNVSKGIHQQNPLFIETHKYENLQTMDSIKKKIEDYQPRARHLAM